MKIFSSFLRDANRQPGSGLEHRVCGRKWHKTLQHTESMTYLPIKLKVLSLCSGTKLLKDFNQ